MTVFNSSYYLEQILNKYQRTYYAHSIFLSYIKVRADSTLSLYHFSSEVRVYKNLRQSVAISVLSICTIPLFMHNQIAAQQPADLASRIAELTIKIDQQKAQNSSYAVRRQAILDDSTKSYEAAEKNVATAARIIKDLSTAVKEEEKMLATLQQDLSSYAPVIAEKETGLKVASNKSHAAVAGFESAAALKKLAVQAADKKVEQAKNDSIALSKKRNKELSDLRDSLSNFDRSITHTKRQMDSITALSATFRKDSATDWKTKDDALTTAAMRLQETRRAIAKSDSLVKYYTNELNSLKKDSSGALSSSAQKGQKREEDARRLDSLSRALQIEKTALYQMQEKFKLDSSIQTFTNEILEMQKTGATAERIEEKQQAIVTYKTKRDNLLRDQVLVKMIAREAKTTREALNAKISTRVIAIDRTLDSISIEQGKISRDNVFLEKEFNEKSKVIVKRIDTLSLCITRSSREGSKWNVQLPKDLKDSADAAAKRNESALEYGKKQPPLAVALKNKTGQHESLKRERDALDKKIQMLDTAARKDCSAAGKVIAAAQKVKDGALGEYNTAAARQQKAREDSIAVTGSLQDTVKKAQLSIEMKKEELTVKKGQHEQIVSQLKKAQDDHAFAVHEKRQQQVTYQKMLSEITLKQIEGEQAQKELETQREVLRKQIGGK
jgi:hypothetical protein